MYILILFTALILSFITITLLVIIFRKKEIFLQHSIEQLTLEKKILTQEIESQKTILSKTEIELLESRRKSLELIDLAAALEKENEALRTLLENLNKRQNLKNDDIVIEYLHRNTEGESY